MLIIERATLQTHLKQKNPKIKIKNSISITNFYPV